MEIKIEKAKTLKAKPDFSNLGFGKYFTDLSPGKTKPLTFSPRSTNCLQIVLPKNPAAPVTKYIVLLIILFSFFVYVLFAILQIFVLGSEELFCVPDRC